MKIEVRHINLSLDTLKDAWNAKLDWEQKDKNRGQDVGGSYFIAKEPKTVAQKCGNRNWPEAKEKGRVGTDTYVHKLFKNMKRSKF